MLDAGRDPETGKRRQRWSRQYTTRREAEAELRKALGRVDVGDDPVPERVSIEQLAERWYKHMDAAGKPKAGVRRGYAFLLDRHVLPSLGRIEARKVRPADVQAVLDLYAETHAPRTVQRLRAVCSSMFAWALRMSIVTVNPVTATSAPTPAKRALRVPEPDEVAAVVEAARGTDLEVGVLLAATTGTRRSELLGLTWRATDFDAGTVRVEGTLHVDGGELHLDETTKTSSGRRTIPLTGEVVTRLRRHRVEQRERRLASAAQWHDLDLVVERGDGTPWNPNRFTEAFRRLARSAGVDCWLHLLRHAYATRLARSGLHPAETSSILGHSSASFTAAVYQHATAETLERTAPRSRPRSTSDRVIEVLVLAQREHL